MHITRALPLLAAWAALVFCGGVTLAKEDKNNGKDRPAAAGQKDTGPSERGGGKGQQNKKKVKKHASGKAMLGEKIKKNGKHEVGKFGNRTLTADVEGGKVRTMAAGDLAPKRVKSHQKMAKLGGTSLASAGALHFIQYDDWYYGYCFDDGYEVECYWYPEEEVYWEDYSWDDYDSYYY